MDDDSSLSIIDLENLPGMLIMPIKLDLRLLDQQIYSVWYDVCSKSRTSNFYAYSI